MDRFINRRARTGPTTLAFHVSRIVIDAGVLMALAAMSTTFITAEGIARDSVSSDALPVILLLAPIFVFTMIPDHSRPLWQPLGWASLALTVVALPLAWIKYLDAANLAATLGAGVGFGARLLIFAVLLAMAGVGLGLTAAILRPDSTKPARRSRSSATEPPTPGQRPATPPGATRAPASHAAAAQQPPRRAPAGQEPGQRQQPRRAAQPQAQPRRPQPPRSSGRRPRPEDGGR